MRIDQSFNRTELYTSIFPEKPVTRFAPSPTGHLHLGHVISLAYIFGIASIVGAKILLRIEDHDTERYRPEYEQSIIDDMAWLGFITDNWEEIALSKKPSQYRQSDSLDVYQDSLAQLQRKGKVYGCECSRKQLVGSEEGVPYAGTCRGKGLKGYGLRFIVDDAEIPFRDILHGELNQNPSKQCGDFLLKDRRGCYSYNFAVVVDDMRHGVNLIIRGEDILHCTGRQIALSRALGGSSSAIYLHHPLVIGLDGKKLSKRTFAEGIIKRRLAGEAPEVVLGDALFHAGLISRNMPIKLKELQEIFQDRT